MDLSINGTIIDVSFKTTGIPAGKNGGWLKPGQCALANKPSSTTGRTYTFQILSSPPEWKEKPWMGFIASSLILFLSNPDYVVSMGREGQRLSLSGARAIRFRKDLTVPLTRKKLSR